jgi:hypothetical protein
MLQETREIEGAPDFETGKPRAGALRYSISAPEEPKGLAFLIPGFGGDSDPDYARGLRSHIVRKHGLAAVSVDYHCLGARPENGAQLQIDSPQHLQLVATAQLNGISLPSWDDIGALCAALGAKGLSTQVPALLSPAGGDLQNFGITQALDHLRVLGDLLQRGPAFNARRIVAVGSSHGGYLAHLIAKIAPRTLAGVVDNSGYVQPPMSHGGGGAAAEYVTTIGGVQLHCRTKRAWSFDDRRASDFYGRDQDLIRDVGHPPHLKIQRAAAGDAGPVFRMANAAVDPISPPEAKQRQAAYMQALGFDARLDLIDEGQIDGRVFKAMVHGLNASIGGFADLHLADCGPRDVDPDTVEGTTVEYPCVDETYRFRHLPRFPFVEGERVQRFNLDGAEAFAAA